jgi:hypothetical protein
MSIGLSSRTGPNGVPTRPAAAPKATLLHNLLKDNDLQNDFPRPALGRFLRVAVVGPTASTAPELHGEKVSRKDAKQERKGRKELNRKDAKEERKRRKGVRVPYVAFAGFPLRSLRLGCLDCRFDEKPETPFNGCG